MNASPPVMCHACAVLAGLSVLRQTPVGIDVTPARFLLVALAGWLGRRQEEAVANLVEENRTLRTRLGGRGCSLTDDQRRRLAVLGCRLGRARPRAVATVVTPDTVLRWHR